MPQPLTVGHDGIVRGDIRPDNGDVGEENANMHNREAVVQQRANPQRMRFRGSRTLGKSPELLVMRRHEIERAFPSPSKDEDVQVEEMDLIGVDWDQVSEDDMFLLGLSNSGYRWDEPVEVVEDRYATMFERCQAEMRSAQAWLALERKKREEAEAEAERLRLEAEETARLKAEEQARLDAAEQAIQTKIDAEEARRKAAEQGIEAELARQELALTRRHGDEKFLRQQAERDALRIERMRWREAIRVAKWKFNFYATPEHQNLELADQADAEVKRLEANPPGKKPQRTTRAQASSGQCAWQKPSGGRRSGHSRGRQPSSQHRGRQHQERYYPSYTCSQCGESHPSNELFVPAINEIKTALGRTAKNAVDVVHSETIRCAKYKTDAEVYKLAQTIGMLEKKHRRDLQGGNIHGGRGREAS